MPASSRYQRKSLLQRLAAGIYFAFWGGLLHYAMMFTGAAADFSTAAVYTFSGAVSGFLLGAVFAVFFFFDSDKTFAQPRVQVFFRILPGSFLMALMAWPLTGFLSNLVESFLGRESPAAALEASVKGALFFTVIGWLTVFGWTVMIFLVLAACLFRSLVEMRRSQRKAGPLWPKLKP